MNDDAPTQIYDGDELIFDIDDPATYIVCETPEDIERALATLATTASDE